MLGLTHRHIVGPCRYCPRVVMTQELLPLIMDAALPGLLVQHRCAHMCSCLMYIIQGLARAVYSATVPFWRAHSTCHRCVVDVRLQAQALRTPVSESSWPTRPASLEVHPFCRLSKWPAAVLKAGGASYQLQHACQPPAC